MTKIRLPYIKEYTVDGRTFRYFRRKGQKAVKLPGLPGSAEFMTAYQAALSAGALAHSSQVPTGTFRKLVMDYYKSVAFTKRKPNTKKLYRHVLDKMVAKHGHRLVRDLQRQNVENILAEIGERAPGMANVTRAVLHKLMKFAVATNVRDTNPVSGVETFEGGTRHTWTEEELAAYEARWPLGTRERLAYEILLRTGQRGGDVVKMRRSDIARGLLHVIQEKTGAELWLPVTAELRRALRAGPTNIQFLIGDERGRQMTRPALTGLIKRAAKEAGLPRRCLPHGLRKALMRRLAELGKTTHEIAAVSGHTTLREIERYTKAARQSILAERALGEKEE